MNQSLPAIGVDSFAYHRWFGEVGPWEVSREERWTTIDFLDRAEALGVEAVSLQTVYLPEITRDSMLDLAMETSRRGFRVVLAWGHRSGLEGGTNPARFAEAMHCVEAAAYLGTPLVRIVCGDQHTWREGIEGRVRRLVPMVGAICRLAERLDMAIAIENHADMTTAQLVDLIGRVGASNLGICFDLGNAVRVGDDLAEAVALAAPFIRMVHVKDMLVQAKSVGDPAAWWPTVPVGSGELPVAEALTTTRTSPHGPGWFVEMANMHPSHPDEDAAVENSLAFLRRRRTAV